MWPSRLTAIVITGALALLAAMVELLGLPHLLQAVFGIPLALVLPGYAAACAALPASRLSPAEQMLATVGASLAITTCVAVLLAATPIGLSRNSAALVLGVGTAAVAACAWLRTRQVA